MQTSEFNRLMKYAHMNDDPYGVMELSSSSVKVSEPNNGTFLEIIRTAGKFGSRTSELMRENTIS